MGKKFHVEGIHEFRDISGDNVVYHVTPDEIVRLALHGLLSATFLIQNWR